MKHFFLLFSLLAAMVLALSGCGAGPTGGLEETPMDAALFDVMTESDRAHFEDFTENPPVRMTVRYDQVYLDAVVEDGALINQMYDAISQIRIRSKTNQSITDAYHRVIFDTADGTSFGLSFEHHLLCVGAEHYELKNDEEFWRLFAQIAEDYSNTPGTGDEPGSPDDANAEYMVNGTAAYPKPEDGAAFLPYFATNETEVLDEALGVTLSAPREITDRTTCNMDVNLDVSITRCALITNNSDKRVQLIPANGLSDDEWKAEVPDYDPSLVLAWDGNGSDLIPLGAASVLEPGESTVVRYAYVGRGGEELDFVSRFSYYVTDGETTELLAGVVLNHIRPSEFPEGRCTVSGTVCDAETGEPIPDIDIQTSRQGDMATTDGNGYFTIEVPAFRFDSTGNWARATIFVNELGLLCRDATANDTYAQESLIVEPRDGESMELHITLLRKPAQVNYTIQTRHDMGMQAYCVDSSHDIVVTTPFHTTFSEEYKYENGYLHVFDKTGALLFEKPLYGESAFCDISTDGTLIASVVHGQKEGEADTAVVWDVNGNEVFSYQVPYKENPALYVQAEEGHSESVFSKLGDLEISNDGTMLLLATDEGYVSVVRLSDRKLVCDFFGNAKMYKLFWSKDDKAVYTGTEAGDFRATEVSTGETLWKKYIEATIFGWAMNDTCVVTSSKATGVGYLICTELGTGKTLWTLDVGMRNSSMALSHDGRTLFWGTDAGTTNERCLFIDMETGTPLWSTMGGKQAAAFSADDRYVVLRTGGNLQLWTTTGEHLYGAIIAPDDNSMSWGVYMSGDCRYIVSFAGGSVEDRHCGVMYALTLDENTPLE